MAVWDPDAVNRTTEEGRGGSGRRQPSAGVRPSAAQPSEERYRRGARRTSAEPLAASWEPDPTEVEEYRPRRRRTGVAGLVSNYGWRIYAVPVLLVLTLLVVLDSTVPASFQIGAAGNGGDSSGTEPRADQTSTNLTTPPAASERPPPKLDLNIPTAELPDGPKFSENGAGTWQVIPGTSDPVGSGRIYKYAIAIEDGVEGGDYGGDKDAFARTVQSFLADNRSWVGTGEVGMQRVDGNTKADFVISLTTTGTTHQICGFQIQYESSCWDPPTKRVVINTARWLRGAKAFSNDISSYRQYAVNHEVGHALGHGHEACQENNAPAPVMMQQTFGVSNDYVAQLNEVDASNKGVVPADGKTCTTNAFPVAPK
ncbi:uncharacterized protein DUF3152 [Umezawaea tangerina]|uniref:Uncharacterized protein DUF3152 n=1 Tax=Umezawaea tangerina TaxID=84725 RepID=A0A2T0TMM2_9PSEU|nr:uncharacterized protein DUF3152 [Umezawaea tangerina]